MTKEDLSLVMPTGLSTARPNKKQVSRERSTERILDSALKLFVRRGYVDTTIDDIAEASDLTKGAVYHYFGSKEELLLELLARIEHESMQVTDEAFSEGLSATDKLVRYLHRQAVKAVERPDSLLFVVTLSANLASVSERVRQQVDAIHGRLAKAFERIIREGVKSGEFRPPISERDLSLFFIAIYSGNVLQWHRSGRQPKVGRALVRALRIAILSILGVNPTPDRVAEETKASRKGRKPSG